MDLKVSSLAARLRGARLGSAGKSKHSDANGSQINHEPARPKMIPAEHIDHGTVEGRQIFYDQVCYLLRKKCK